MGETEGWGLYKQVSSFGGGYFYEGNKSFLCATRGPISLSEINNYLEDQSVDRNGTTAGSENGAEINSEPTTSTDANRQADLPMANRRSLLHLIAPSDLSALGEPATQPHLQAFPSTIIDGKYRSFNAKWYERFNWIEYSQSKDLIFCKACRHFPEQHTEGTFTKEGFKNSFYKTNL